MKSSYAMPSMVFFTSLVVPTSIPDIDTDSAKRKFRRQEELVETAIVRRPYRAGRKDNDWRGWSSDHIEELSGRRLNPRCCSY